MGITTAILGAGAIGAGAGLLGSSMQADAASQAGQMQADAATTSALLQKQMFEEQQAAQAPWRTAGQQALYSLENLMGLSADPKQERIQQIQKELDFRNNNLSAKFGPSWVAGVQGPDTRGALMQELRSLGGTYDPNLAYNRSGDVSQWSNPNAAPAQMQAPATVTTAAGQQGTFGSLMRPFAPGDLAANVDPGYQFRLQTGTDTLANYLRASGMSQSGAAERGITDYAQQAGSQEYQNAYNRWAQNQANIFNRLSGIAGTGQQSAQNIGQMGMQTAGNIGALGMQGSAAQAAGQMGAANAQASMYNQLGQLPMNYLMMSKLFGSGGNLSGYGGGGGALTDYSGNYSLGSPTGATNWFPSFGG